MPRDIRVVDAALAGWVLAWLIAAVFVFEAVTELEDGARAVVSAGEGLDETSQGLRRVGRALHETGDALDGLGDLPFVSGDPGAAVRRTAEDVDRFAVRVDATGRDARVAGAKAQESVRDMAILLALAVALAPTLPALGLYLLLRPLLLQPLRR